MDEAKFKTHFSYDITIVKVIELQHDFTPVNIVFFVPTENPKDGIIAFYAAAFGAFSISLYENENVEKVRIVDLPIVCEQLITALKHQLLHVTANDKPC